MVQTSHKQVHTPVKMLPSQTLLTAFLQYGGPRTRVMLMNARTRMGEPSYERLKRYKKEEKTMF